MSNETPPIIIIRRKGGHGGHHGGAWKVAYADFVTAMMALFIVLWLLNSSEQVKKAISAYFTDPSSSSHQIGSANAGTGETLKLTKNEMVDLKDKLEQELKKSPELAALKDNIQMSVSGEGLRIELIETEHGLFFDSGSSKPSELGVSLLQILTKQLAQLPNNLSIEGHTDARPFTSRAEYSNWDSPRIVPMRPGGLWRPTAFATTRLSKCAASRTTSREWRTTPTRPRTVGLA